MLTPKFLTFLCVGTAAMLVPILLCGHWGTIKWYKCFIIAVLLTLVGTVGTYLMGAVENSFYFGNRSFYGAVFTIPVAFLIVAPLVRVKYGELMDLCAPAICVMLSLMKVLCLLEGCCGGCLLYVAKNGTEVCFPSQIVELMVAIALVVVLLFNYRKGQLKGLVFPNFLVLYGASRLILNSFRNGLTVFAFGLPAGHFWSLIAIGIGVCWLVLHKHLQQKQLRE